MHLRAVGFVTLTLVILLKYVQDRRVLLENVKFIGELLKDIKRNGRYR